MFRIRCVYKGFINKRKILYLWRKSPWVFSFTLALQTDVSDFILTGLSTYQSIDI